MPKIITAPTANFAPEDTPSTYGPAIGLRKNVCSRKPDTLSVPPITAAASTRGRRILSSTL